MASYLPDLGPGEVAGGAAGLLLAAPPAADDLVTGGVLRRWVPTPRQRAAGEEGVALDVLTADLPPVPDPVRVPRSARAAAFLRDLDLRAIPGAKLPLLVLMLGNLVGGWGDSAVELSLPEIQASFGLSAAGIVTVASVFNITTQAVGLPLGYLVDRVRRVWLVRIGAIGDAVGTLLMAVAGGVGALIGANALTSATRAAGSPATLPLITDYFPSRARARVVALLFVSGTVGGLLGTAAAGLLLSRYGWRPTLLVLGLVALLAAGLVFLLREPVRGGVDRLEMGASRERAAQEPPPPSFGEALRGAMAIRTLRLLAIAGMVTTVAEQPIRSVIQLTLANRFLLGPGQRSVIEVATHLLIPPSVLLGAVLADRLLASRPRTVMILFGAIHVAIALLLIVEATAPALWVFVAAQVATGVLTASIAPAVVTTISLIVPARFRGLGLQVTTPFALIGALVTPVLLQTAASSADTQAIFFLLVPFMLLGTLLYFGMAGTVGPDIRAARAAAMAQEEVQRAQLGNQSKALVVRDLDVAYADVQVLFHVDLDVREGEVVALVGTNGAGKSTLLRAVCGLQQAANGAIFFEGRDITSSPAHENARRGLVYMPGGQGVFPALTVRENLTTAAAMVPGGGIETVLELFPVLRERLDSPAGVLSGGEQQMVAVGQAFLLQPRLLMIDELSLGLAPAVIEQLLGVIRRMRDSGVTIILVEQSLNVALTIADRAVFMERGTVEFDGPTGELLGRPDLVRAVFMGGSGGGAATRSRRRPPGSPSEGPETRLAAAGVTVGFGGVQALSDVSLSVGAGEVVGIIGPNGAGKTTLFDILSGYLAPDSGRVHLSGRDVTALSPDARARLGLGRAFQNARLFPPLTVRENIAVALERRASRSTVLAALWAGPVRRSERTLQARVDGFIELLGLIPYADKFVRELSTGTRRAVEVACQLAADPDMLLLDEPSSGLAQAETEALGPALLRLVRETGCGLLVIEHDLPLITSISDRLVAMELGRVLVAGPPEQVVADQRVLTSYLAASNDVIERSGSRVGSVLAAVGAAATPAGPTTGGPARAARRKEN